MMMMRSRYVIGLLLDSMHELPALCVPTSNMYLSSRSEPKAEQVVVTHECEQLEQHYKRAQRYVDYLIYKNCH
jgi:hypothetical protein